MGRYYRHITSEDRIAICHLLKAGLSKDKIAKQLGFHRSTLYREIKRNGTRLGYFPLVATRKIELRLKRGFKLNRNHKLRNYIFEKLKASWSPEQIAGRLKLEQGQSLICHETIYAYLYSDYGIRNKYYTYLRRKRLFRYPKISRNHKIKIPNRTPIAERPSEINTREIFGHWECDLMQFKRPIKTNLITLRERKSRYMLAIKNENRESVPTANKIINNLKDFKNLLVQSITFDNGLEFRDHGRIAEKLQIQTYFCEPYKSYQKGTIENGNKQLREWFPREIRADILTQLEINRKLKLINRRPMKSLNYRTPEEILLNE